MSSFQFVILDTPPVLPMADARVLARMVEGVVLVVRAGQVPKPMLRRAFTLLEATGANVLGAVFNGADPRGEGYRHYEYYHQYYER
jgi:Mrp family chromosome partitioning ATPase